MSAIDYALQYVDARAIWMASGESLQEVAADELAQLRAEGAIQVNLLTKKDGEIISLRAALQQAREALRDYLRYGILPGGSDYAREMRAALAAIDAVLGGGARYDHRLGPGWPQA